MNKQVFTYKVCEVSDIQLCLWSESKHELGRRPSQPARWRRDTWGAGRTAATSAAAARASLTGSAASGVTLSGTSEIGNCSLLRCHQETPSCCWTSLKSGRTNKMKKTRKWMWPARAVMRQNSKIAKILADPSKWNVNTNLEKILTKMLRMLEAIWSVEVLKKQWRNLEIWKKNSKIKELS